MKVVSYDGSIGSELLDEYRTKGGLSRTAPSDMRYFLAIDSDVPVGIVGFNKNNIKLLYTVDSAPEDTEQGLLKAVMADVINQGISSLSIHSMDINGRADRICRGLGFSDDGICPCSQREGTVCLKRTF